MRQRNALLPSLSSATHLSPSSCPCLSEGARDLRVSRPAPTAPDHAFEERHAASGELRAEHISLRQGYVVGAATGAARRDDYDVTGAGNACPLHSYGYILSLEESVPFRVG
ncbi:unnamed protein product, partial [Brenthis ino]